MPAENKLELVVEVDVNKANASIKTINTGLSSMEQAASQAARGAAAGMDQMTASMVKGATAGNLIAESIKKALDWAKEWTIGAAQFAAHTDRMGLSMQALAKAHGVSAAASNRAVEAVKSVGFSTEAATRTQPSLPCAPGHCATETSDYKRHGTTTLFAGMNMGSGKVVYTFHPQHRHPEWIQFLGLIEEHTPPGKQIHLIIDNYSAHKHAAVRAWLGEHPRFHIHYTPTSGSWLNQVERLLGEVTTKCLRRRTAETVAALEQDIGEYFERRNEHPKSFRWKASAVEILRKVKRAWGVLHDRYGAKKPSAALASIERRLAVLDDPATLATAT